MNRRKLKGGMKVKKRVKDNTMILSECLDCFYRHQQQKGIRNLRRLRSSIKLILRYEGFHDIFLRQIDKKRMRRFIEWISRDYKISTGGSLSEGSQWFYISEFSKALNFAVKSGWMGENPFKTVKKSDIVRKEKEEPEFLTAHELKQMEMTYCENDSVRNAYLFSCYTGLRISDIRNLTYKEIVRLGDKFVIALTMKKTDKPVFVPLSCHALRHLPDRRDQPGDEKVFNNLPAQATINNILKKWALKAGIKKHLTYHTSRHTFGTLMVTAGVDLYTTSKLMGHTDIRTTRIYAKIIDSKKIEAISLLDQYLRQ